MESNVSINHWKAKQELRIAVQQLQNRGLVHSAAWAAELLTQIELNEEDSDDEGALDPRLNDDPPEDICLLALSYFNLKEYDRAAYCLKVQKATSSYALFLRGYATFLAGEKRKEEETLEKSDPMEKSQVINKNLKELQAEFRQLKEDGKLDGFGLFLYGLVLKERDRPKEARGILCESVNKYPWNWSAWKQLSSLCKDKDVMPNLEVNTHWMKLFFLADVLLELHQHEHEEVLHLLDALSQQFPKSTHVLAQQAMAHYNKREFDEAQNLFEDLRELDPYRLENMDSYSNILYVKESKAELSYLAQEVVRNNKYRSQTCCIIGNYYSLKGKHEKAVQYFKRALKLDPDYLSAWTLMGHEYVELRNTSASIEAYRRAVDIDPCDYRAWYGLGQTYEILQMHNYSLYYFRKATKLRPYDPRMWCAMAESYERLGRIEDAIKCYLRAEGNQDREGIALNKLAKLYKKMEDHKMAALYYKKVLERTEESDGSECTEAGTEVGPDVVEALLYLAEYCKNDQNYEESVSYCNRLLDIGGPIREDAKSLLMEIEQLKKHKSSMNDASIVDTSPIQLEQSSELFLSSYVPFSGFSRSGQHERDEE